MFLNKTMQSKIRKMVDYAKKSNELQQEIIDWFKSKGYDITEGHLEGCILDGIIDTTQRTYDAENLIGSIENTMQEEDKTLKQEVLNVPKKIRIRKRLNYELPTCGECSHWQQKNDGWMGYCPILKKDTEADESCNDFEDIKE